MENQQTAQVIKQIINFWEANNKNITAFYTKYEDDVYKGQVAPGRNSAVYLLAHLIAISDGLLPLFGLGDRVYPDLQQFSGEAEANITHTVTIAELKEKWEAINSKLSTLFATQTTDWWLARHMSVSEADFALDPNRNKLNVLLSRASHENYHRGQLVFLTVAEPAL